MSTSSVFQPWGANAPKWMSLTWEPPVTLCLPVDSAAVHDAGRLVDDLVGRLRPVEVELARAWWDASTRASDEANRRKAELELARRQLLADPDAFAAVGAARADADDGGGVRRPPAL